MRKITKTRCDMPDDALKINVSPEAQAAIEIALLEVVNTASAAMQCIITECARTIRQKCAELRTPFADGPLLGNPFPFNPVSFPCDVPGNLPVSGSTN